MGTRYLGAVAIVLLSTVTPGLAQVTATPPTVTPVVPSSTSATCMSGCTIQVQACQNTCISTINGTTVIPSVTTQGVATSPGQCVSNCSTQQQLCLRNCILD
jgi:hypothetical protein